MPDTFDGYSLLRSLLSELGHGSCPPQLWLDAAVNHYFHPPLERLRRTLVAWALAVQGTSPFRPIDWQAHAGVIAALSEALDESASRFIDGIPEPITPGMPPHWPDYSCDDYLFSDFAERGHWDDAARLWLIEPVIRAREYPESAFLQVGRPGVDDIGFGYRRRFNGFWAIHRGAEPHFQQLASTVQDFMQRWTADEIRV
jgi:hypothetical protein